MGEPLRRRSTDSTGEFTRIATLNTARGNASTALLTSGQVLVAGGYGANGDLTSAELYQPGTNAFALLESGNTFSGTRRCTAR